jgi:3-oxoacyl-[acyl-carrier protein] reductase
MISEKVAVITGGARGIGNEIALQLSKEGYAIAIFDILNIENVQENIDRIKKNEESVLYFQGNLSNRKDHSDFCETVFKQFGRIDVLVNNSGVAPKNRMDLLKMSEESFDYVLDINLKGTFFFTQKVANLMIENKEKNPEKIQKIINISSMSAYTSSTSRGEYCMSKAGVSMLTKLFADRLSEYHIYVYEIRPGIIFTDMTKKVKEKYDEMISKGLTPIKRWGYPQDVAQAVSVFCSEKLNFSTGEIINVDGGFHLRRF